jgi:hypothetical protein
MMLTHSNAQGCTNNKSLLWRYSLITNEFIIIIINGIFYGVKLSRVVLQPAATVTGDVTDLRGVKQMNDDPDTCTQQSPTPFIPSRLL